MPEFVSEVRREWSNVGYEGGRNQTVSNHSQLLILEVDNVLLPSDNLISKTINETVGQVERLLKGCSLGNDSLLLCLSFSKIVLQFVHLSDNLRYSLLNLSELLTLLISFLLGGLSRSLERLDNDEDIVVLDDVDDPVS